MHARTVSDNMIPKLVSVFILLAICLGAAGRLYYSRQKGQTNLHIQDELSAIADLKVKQIESWRKERLDDAAAVSRTGTFAVVADRFFKNPNDAETKGKILVFLRTFQSVYGYRSIILADSRGAVRLALPAAESSIGSSAKASLREAFRTGKVILTDIHKASVVDYAHLDLLAPLFTTSGTKTTAVGALLFRIDSDLLLDQLFRFWPGSSKTAETLLFRREGDEAVVQNETRHQKGTALTLRVPLSKKPALAAVLDGGGAGVIEIEDYRDVPVLAAVRRVPRTDWFLVAKVDREELYAPLHRQAVQLLVVVLALITASGVSIILWWRQKSAEFAKDQYEAELKRRMLSQQYDYLSRYANDIILLIGPTGNIIEANKRAATAYGYTHDELLRLNITDLRPPETRDEIAAQMRHIKERRGFVFETMHCRKDGTTFPVEVSSSVIDVDGNSCFQSIVRDITERKQAEAALIKEKNRSEAIIAAFADGISIQDRDFRILYQNKVHRDMAGSHIGEYCYQVYKHGGTRCEGCPVAESFKDGQIHTTERSLLSGEGTRYFEITSSPLKDETGAIIAGIEVVREITARKKADAALRERNAFIETILDNIPIGLAVNTITDGRMIYMNTLFGEIYGWPKNVLLDAEQFFIRVYPDPVLRKNMKDRIMADIASGDPLRMRWDNVPITTQTGETKFVAAVNIPLYEQGLMISTVLDITSRKKAEQAKIESEHRYKRLVESVTDYIYSVEVRDGSAAATLHGPGCVNVTGYTPEEYQADPDLWLRMIFEEDRGIVVEHVNKILANVLVAPFEHRILHKDGSLHWVRNTPVLRHDNEGRLISYDGMITDITPLKQLENQLRQAQKMEAVGQLAGGVAHDFNNILTAIIGYANLLLMKLPEREPGRAFVEQILSSSERAAQLTHSLLAFSRKQIIDLRPVSLHDIINRVKKLLGRVIGEDIEFKTRLADTDLAVLADSIQIEQVLMNLAANARDAMPDGGTLLIETELLELGEEFVRAHSYGKPGRYAYIAVTDTGVGMDERTRNRIFEPFFTTKEVGKGTGLGLSMVYGIVKQHNGYITVDSEPGEGTTFKIYLPLVQPPVEEKFTQPATASRGTETVLLAEDDEAVRNLTRSILEDFGYRVIEAADGEEAVRKFGDNKGAIDLLVLDIIMPKKNGKETYQEIRTIQPDIRALFTSGYTADIVHKKGILDTGLDFVLKPITPTAFLKKVREVLDRE